MNETMATLGLQSGVLLLMTAVVAWGMRRASAAARHLVWTLGMAWLLLLPLWPEQARVVEFAPIGMDVTRIVVRPEGTEESNQSVDWWWWAWLCGAVMMAGREVVAQLASAGVAGRARRWREDAWMSAEIGVPVVCGLWRPRIVLPEEAQGWDERRLAAVMAHERMHVERGDLWWQLVGRMARAVYWLNPLAWVALREQRMACEKACDDGVLGRGVAAAEYAEHLLEIAKALPRQRNLEGGLAMAQTSKLEKRLRAVLDPLVERGPLTRGTAVLAMALSVLLLAPVGALRLMAQSGGGVTGVVMDASGAHVPGAKVTVRFLNPASQGRVELVRTDEAGRFAFPAVPEDEYMVLVEKEGFAVLTNTSLKLGGAGAAPLVFTLNVGGLRERVTVNGGALPPPPPPPPPPSTYVAQTPSRLRVGGNVQAAKLVNKVSPLYPQDCKREGVSGIVLLNAVIGKDGSVVSLEPVNEFVDGRLRDAAMSAVKLWRYQTTLLNGNPVEVATVIEVNFTLAP